ncbi:hypothetical protein BGY98DRAFT_936644 [Russula aff. rugulosa BPL654]|nr:hypothetical protein BGY98DRAFT_936644 [Russula aff. rugulosa BPL654]
MQVLVKTPLVPVHGDPIGQAETVGLGEGGLMSALDVPCGTPHWDVLESSRRWQPTAQLSNPRGASSVFQVESVDSLTILLYTQFSTASCAHRPGGDIRFNFLIQDGLGNLGQDRAMQMQRTAFRSEGARAISASTMNRSGRARAVNAFTPVHREETRATDASTMSRYMKARATNACANSEEGWQRPLRDQKRTTVHCPMRQPKRPTQNKAQYVEQQQLTGNWQRLSGEPYQNQLGELGHAADAQKPPVTGANAIPILLNKRRWGQPTPGHLEAKEEVVKTKSLRNQCNSSKGCGTANEAANPNTASTCHIPGSKAGTKQERQLAEQKAEQRLENAPAKEEITEITERMPHQITEGEAPKQECQTPKSQPTQNQRSTKKSNTKPLPPRSAD